MNLCLFTGGLTAPDQPAQLSPFQTMPVTPPVPHDGGGLLPVTFDGRRRATKPLDAQLVNGMTVRDKKLLQFRDQLVKRRKQLNMRQNTAQMAKGGVRTAIER